jgi:mono/diheme cytochrome c family protein
MIDRWPLRHGTALGIAMLVLLSIVVAVFLHAAAHRGLAIGYAAEGEYVFADHCGGCHGAYAHGTGEGPSLVDARLAPLDGDVFERAARRGTGAMPEVEGLDDQDLADVIAFVNGLRAGDL